MRTAYLLYALVALSAGVLFGVDTASAQATRTWVSGVGDDVNPCSRTAPCKTFAGAISKTAAGGEINCLDPAGFGAVTITKSMTIDCTGTFGSILSSSTTGVIINGAGALVTLRGLSINGAPPTLPGVNGVRFLQGTSLIVEDCIIHNFAAASGTNGNGILLNPTAGTLRLLVNNTKIVRNGTTVGTGIFIVPTGATNINAVITNSSIDDNLNGIQSINNGSGTIKVSVANTSASNNASSGIVASGANNSVNVINAVVANNSTGLSAAGSGVIRVGSSMITGNATGVTNTVQSYANNQLLGNTSNGTPAVIGLN